MKTLVYLNGEFVGEALQVEGSLYDNGGQVPQRNLELTIIPELPPQELINVPEYSNGEQVLIEVEKGEQTITIEGWVLFEGSVRSFDELVILAYETEEFYLQEQADQKERFLKSAEILAKLKAAHDDKA